MCNTHHLRSRNCGHHWLQISRPCYPGWGFNHCDTFGDGIAREPSPLLNAEALCPACAYGGRYDKNQVRMIMNIKDRWRWGEGPCKRDSGLECVIL